MPIQYNFGRECDAIQIGKAQWREICTLLHPPAPTPQSERQAIREAVTMLDRIAGTQTPIHRDLGRNRQNPLGDGCMDCRDESANTTTYLALLDQHGLLYWHDVMKRTFRGPLQFDSHWSALIRDRTDGALFVVDPWYLDHGNPPRIQKLDDWLRKRPPPTEIP